jgi:hypothetical protein
LTTVFAVHARTCYFDPQVIKRAGFRAEIRINQGFSLPEKAEGPQKKPPKSFVKPVFLENLLT